MSKGFFSESRPGQVVRDLELPILYHRLEVMLAMFSADYQKVRELMPCERLHPVRTLNGRALVTIGCHDVLASSVGRFGTAPINVAVVYGKKPPPLLPALGFEAAWEGYGHLCLHLPGDSSRKQESTRSVWGLPAFIADMTFENTPEQMRCAVKEGERSIFSLHVAKHGLVLPVPPRIHVYSVLDRALHRATWEQAGFLRTTLASANTVLELGDTHPVARALQALDIDPRGLRGGYTLDLQAKFPAGQVLETGVRPLDAYRGAERDGSLVELMAV